MKFNEMQFNRGLVMHFIVQTNFYRRSLSFRLDRLSITNKAFQFEAEHKVVFPWGRTTPQRFPSLITDNEEKVRNFLMKLWTSNVANKAIVIFFSAMLEVFSQCVFTEQTQQYSIKLLNVFSSLKHITAVITPFSHDP